MRGFPTVMQGLVLVQLPLVSYLSLVDLVELVGGLGVTGVALIAGWKVVSSSI